MFINFPEMSFVSPKHRLTLPFMLQTAKNNRINRINNSTIAALLHKRLQVNIYELLVLFSTTCYTSIIYWKALFYIKHNCKPILSECYSHIYKPMRCLRSHFNERYPLLVFLAPNTEW